MKKITFEIPPLFFDEKTNLPKVQAPETHEFDGSINLKNGAIKIRQRKPGDLILDRKNRKRK